MSKAITRSAGIDTSKARLDVAVFPSGERVCVENTPDGHDRLLAWLDEHRIRRVGIEATGGYESAVVRRLRRGRKKVAVLQPRQVRAFAVYKGLRAKSDPIDAFLIAECTAKLEEIRSAPDDRLEVFSKHLLFVEQIEEDIARLKCRCEHYTDQRILRHHTMEIERLRKRLKAELALLQASACKHADLKQRFELIESVDGVGPRTALALVILLPELGTLGRERIAALVGVAPFDDQSGQRDGPRHIAGGRDRVRKSLYAAALPASFQWNQNLLPIYRRLTEREKPHKLALIACTRKLLIYIDAVVGRGTPWTKHPVACHA